MSHQLRDTSKTLFLVLISKYNFQMLDGPFYLHILYYFILSTAKSNSPSLAHSPTGLLSEIPRWAGSTDTAMHTVGRRTEGGLEDFPCWASRSQLPSSKHSTQNLPELFPHRDLAQTHFSPLKTHLRTGLSALGSPFSSSIHPHSRQVLSQESLALGSAPGPKISKRPRAGESATYPLA